MLSEAHYNAVLNFFFFLLTDEAMALSASYKTIKQIQKKMKKRDDGAVVDADVVREMHRTLEKFANRQHEVSSPPPESNWRVPQREYLAVWREQIRKLDRHGAEALVLRYILDFKPETISEGLGVPEGTVFFRLGHGLQALASSSFTEVAGR